MEVKIDKDTELRLGDILIHTPSKDVYRIVGFDVDAVIVTMPEIPAKNMQTVLRHVVEEDFVLSHQPDTSKKVDMVNHPPHYTWLQDICGIEVIDITRHLDFDTGNAVKYILRAGHKDITNKGEVQATIEDLKKAVWYLNDRIKSLEKDLV